MQHRQYSSVFLSFLHKQPLVPNTLEMSILKQKTSIQQINFANLIYYDVMEDKMTHLSSSTYKYFLQKVIWS